MPLPALQKFEKKIGRQFRLLEVRKNLIERKIERQIRLFEEKRDGIGKKIEQQIKQFELRKGIRLDDEVRFLRSWIERPLTVGAVTPSGKILARAMARYVDPNSTGPVVELGPGTGPVTEALVAAGVDPSRLVWSNSIRLSAASCATAIPTPLWCRATPIACAGFLRRCSFSPPPP